MLLFALGGLVLGWLARGFHASPPSLAATVSAAPIVADATPPPPPSAQRIARAETPFASGGGKRNLFAYREEARVAEKPRAYVIAEEPAPAVVVSVSEPVRPEAPPFPYRLIGTFGTQAKRFAAFTRDGEVIAVRAGRNIGSDYVLRSIGIESVEVQRVADASSLRVPLGDSR